MLVNYKNPSYGLSIATFVSGSAEWKNMGGDSSSKTHVGLVLRAAEPSPLAGERGWSVIFLLSSDNFVNTGCKSKVVVCVNSYRSFLTYGMVKSIKSLVTSETQEGNTRRQHKKTTRWRHRPSMVDFALPKNWKLYHLLWNDTINNNNLDNVSESVWFLCNLWNNRPPGL